MPSLYVRGHRRTVAGGGRPVINPPLANSVGAINQLPARLGSLLNDHDDSGIELLLRMVDIRKSRPFRRNHILDRYFCPVSLEDGAAVFISAGRREIPQDKEIRHFFRSRQSHEV